mmetsp:Transcript_48194/g.135645  ORF Transcript_48194/g.135645 Transcript_48194/m.135645 type:complete len:200 (+) Transcript_48194:93-692(+)
MLDMSTMVSCSSTSPHSGPHSAESPEAWPSSSPSSLYTGSWRETLTGIGDPSAARAISERSKAPSAAREGSEASVPMSRSSTRRKLCSGSSAFQRICLRQGGSHVTSAPRRGSVGCPLLGPKDTVTARRKNMGPKTRSSLARSAESSAREISTMTSPEWQVVPSSLAMGEAAALLRPSSSVEARPEEGTAWGREYFAAM